MIEKSVGELRLIEACRQGGCPVCSRVREESLSHLRALVGEHVTDPDTRRALRASWGLCNWHTWMLLEVDPRALGASIYYEDLLREAIDRVTTLADRPRRSRLGSWLARLQGRDDTPAIVAARDRRLRCTLCVVAAETERQSLVTLATMITNAEIASAYAASNGVCLPHVVRAVEIAPRSREVRVLVTRTLEKWLALRGTLQSFIAKHDYRNRTAYTEEEAASYTRSFEVMAGARGVFGNDLVAGRGDARRPRTRAP